MALNFPSSPTVGDEFTGGGFTWTWTGTTWSKLAPASGSNDFTLLVGSSGNTTYVLDRTYAAGSYKLIFVNGDTTYDIYAIAENGTNAGYTNNTVLVATEDFNEISILGAASNEVVNFKYEGSATSPSSAGDVSTAGAYITSISDSTLVNVDDSTTVTGGNFATNVAVTFTGTDSVARNAKNIVRSSSTSLIVTRPDLLPPSAAPYTVKVSNSGIPLPTGTNSHILSNAVTAGGAPAWVTSAVDLYTVGSAYTATLSASDADSAITYSIVSGALPTGLSLNSSTGVISGTPTAGGGNAITFRATDSGGNFSDRAIGVNEVPPATASLEKMVAASTSTTRVTSGTSFTLPTGDANGYYVVATLVGGGGRGGSGYFNPGRGKGQAGEVVTSSVITKYASGASIAYTVGAGAAAAYNGGGEAPNVAGNPSSVPSLSLTAPGAVGGFNGESSGQSAADSTFQAGGTYSWRPSYRTYSGGGHNGSYGGSAGVTNVGYGTTGGSGGGSGGTALLGSGGGGATYQYNNNNQMGGGGNGFVEFYVMPVSAYVY